MRINRPLADTVARQLTVGACITLLCGVAECLLGALLPSASITTRALRAASVALTLGGVHIGAKAVLTGYQGRKNRCYATLYTLCAVSVVIVAIVNVIELALIQYGNAHMLRSDIKEASLAFALPYASAILVVQSTLGLHLGIVTAVMSAIVFSVYSPISSLALGLVATSSIAGCLAFQRVRSRGSYIQAALSIALVMIPFAVASMAIVPPAGAIDAISRVVGCVVSGFLSALVALAITPFVEYFAGYASDMRLIEMATLDHPLLKELSIQAPGTWNHSMVIGMMVESAADAIGANAVVCRVGAYFHDIGKTKKPVYFVENQTPGENRHDKLSPSMSALIIRSHVKDGIELARKYKLPKVIEDMIPQHHGTSVIDYFYDKARKEAEEAGRNPEEVDRSLYQYPGPKPQTREAGLLMLADGIEAAARTLSEPSQDRIQGLVQKMLNKVFASGELNECDLTLQDLHCIAKCFTRVLTGIYHQRIAYAEPAEKVVTTAEVSAAREARENLKRLGIE